MKFLCNLHLFKDSFKLNRFVVEHRKNILYIKQVVVSAVNHQNCQFLSLVSHIDKVRSKVATSERT